MDSREVFTQSEDRLVATVGIENMMIIDTADALLVVHSDKVQDVKKISALLKGKTIMPVRYIVLLLGHRELTRFLRRANDSK